MKATKSQLAAILREHAKREDASGRRTQYQRGLSHQVLGNQRGFKGGTPPGPASPGRTLSVEERNDLVRKMKDEWRL